MKKVTRMLFAVLILSSFLAAPAEARPVKAAPKAVAVKTVAADTKDQVALEAAWISSPEYQAAVKAAADAYAKKMNVRCQGFVDASAAIKAYNVYTPPGAEAARDRLVKLQIVSLACAKTHDDGMARAALLRM